MIFTIKSDNPALTKLYIKLDAPFYLIKYPKKVNEQLLDKYLRENYKKQLIPVCLQIINSMKFSINKKELIITIPNKELSELANLITFGTGKIPGSKILKFAIMKGDFD